MANTPGFLDFYDSDEMNEILGSNKKPKKKQRSQSILDNNSEMNIKDVLYLKNKISSLKKDVLKYKSRNNELRKELNKSMKINENLKKDYELKLTKCNNEIKKLKNENKSTNRGTILSPTLMAILTQNFMNNNVNVKDGGTMKTLHKELKGMMHASKNTFEWFGKNIGNNDDMKSDNGSQICLNDYDLMSLCFMRNIGNQILNVNGKYTENVRNWVNKLNNCIKMKTNPVNYKKWQSSMVIYLINICFHDIFLT